MDIGGIIGTVLSVGSGGIFGLLGSAVGVIAKIYQEKQRQKWERSKWDHETKLIELNMQARAQETEHELAVVAQEGAWRGLDTSLKAEAAISQVSVWVNNIRALFRPFLTVMLWVLAGWVFYQIINDGLAEWLTDADVTDLIKYMVQTIFFAASTAGVWWFGDRALTPPNLKRK